MRYFNIIIIFMILGCSDSKDYRSETSADILFIPNSKGLLNTTQVPKNLLIIKLDTIANAFIGKVDKIIQHKERFFILDKYLASSVKIFNNKGKYINHIDKQFFSSKGKLGELIEFSDIDVFKDTLYLLDGVHQKILYFDINGVFLKEKDLPFYAYSLAKMEWGIVFFKNLTKNREEDTKYSSDIIVVNNDFEIINKYKNFKHLNGVTYDRLCLLQPLSKSGDDILFRQFFSDTIWQINREHIKVKNIIDYETGSKTEKIRQIFASKKFEDFVKIVNEKYKNISIGGDFIFDSPNYTILHYSSNLKPCLFIKNKVSKTNSIIKSIQSKGINIPYPIGINENYFISVLDEARLEDMNHKNTSSEFQKMVTNVLERGQTYLFLFNI